MYNLKLTSPLKPYVTEVDLRHSLIPDELVEDLLASMPPHKGPDLQEDRHLPKYDYISFMEKMTAGNVVKGEAGDAGGEEGEVPGGGVRVNGNGAH